jgi:DNA-binding response OmpR family regulator
MRTRILVVEDDPGIRAVLERGLALAGHLPTFAGDIASARRAWSDGSFDLILLDVMLPDGDGLDLLSARREAGDTTPAIVLSAREETELRSRARVAGVTASLPKPFVYEELVATIRAALGTGPQPISRSGSSRGAPIGG